MIYNDDFRAKYLNKDVTVTFTAHVTNAADGGLSLSVANAPGFTLPWKAIDDVETPIVGQKTSAA